MGFLSSSISITRYKVEGKPGSIDDVIQGLGKNTIKDIDSEASEISIGWTLFEKPFNPDFKNFSSVIGEYILFSLRIDKKVIPSKIFQKHYADESAKRLEKSEQKYLSQNEKKEVKDHVNSVLFLRIPATPNIYDVIWDYEKEKLYFCSTIKSANEEFETLFSKSFKISLIRLFPFTMAYTSTEITDSEQDVLKKAVQTKFIL